MRSLFAAVALPALMVSSLSHATPWQIDPAHSSAQFAVRHMMVSTVRGEFGKVTGTVNLDDKDVAKSTIEATIDVTSIDTRQPKRDEHLKSPDFFDAAKYPTMTFKSTSIKKAGNDKYKVAGNLTIRGVTKPVTLDVYGPGREVKDMMGMMRKGAHATTTINRKDFGLNWNAALEAGGVAVSDEVKVELDVEMTKSTGGGGPGKPPSAN